MKSRLAIVLTGMIFSAIPIYSQNITLFGGHIIPQLPNPHAWYEFLEIDTHATIDGKDVALRQTILVDKYPIPSTLDGQVNYLSVWKVRAIDWPALALYINSTSDKKISKYWYYEYLDGKWQLAKHLVGSGDVVADTQELNKFLKEKYK